MAAQQIPAARPTTDGQARRFALAGLIHCGACDQRLDSHRNHGRPTYRCRHGHRSTQRASQPRPKTPSFKIAFHDPWGNTVSETELIHKPTLKFITDLQLE